MQRNKLIYVLADATLVVNSDYEKGGTWVGAIEQWESLRLVPVYVRSNGVSGKGPEALRRKGARSWPNPSTPEEFIDALSAHRVPQIVKSDKESLSFDMVNEAAQQYEIQNEASVTEAPPCLFVTPPATPAEELFATVALELKVSKSQAKDRLQRLVKEGVLEKLSNPARYRSTVASGRLF